MSVQAPNQAPIAGGAAPDPAKVRLVFRLPLLVGFANARPAMTGRESAG